MTQRHWLRLRPLRPGASRAHEWVTACGAIMGDTATSIADVSCTACLHYLAELRAELHGLSDYLAELRAARK